MDSESVLTAFAPLPDFTPLASIAALDDFPLALRLLQLDLEELPRAGFSRDEGRLLSECTSAIEEADEGELRPTTTTFIRAVKGTEGRTEAIDDVQERARRMSALANKVSLLSACCGALLSSSIDGRGVISAKAASVWISVVVNLEAWEAVVAEQEKVEQSETSSRLMKGAAGGTGPGAGADPHGWAARGDAKVDDDDDYMCGEELREYTAKEVRECVTRSY